MYQVTNEQQQIPRSSAAFIAETYAKCCFKIQSWKVSMYYVAVRSWKFISWLLIEYFRIDFVLLAILFIQSSSDYTIMQNEWVVEKRSLLTMFNFLCSETSMRN